MAYNQYLVIVRSCPQFANKFHKPRRVCAHGVQASSLRICCECLRVHIYQEDPSGGVNHANMEAETVGSKSGLFQLLVCVAVSSSVEST